MFDCLFTVAYAAIQYQYTLQYDKKVADLGILSLPTPRQLSDNPDLDSRLAYPRPRPRLAYPRPRLSSFKTKTKTQQFQDQD